MSAATLRRAHAVHPIAAVQTEYSLWTRNPEIAVLDACRELGVAFVAFSPLARGFLGGELRDVAALDAKDIRRSMPRFEPANYAANLQLLRRLRGASPPSAAARRRSWRWPGCWRAASMSWRSPARRSVAHLRDNAGAAAIELDAATMARLDALINRDTIVGARYDAAAQAGVDTEEF